MYLSPCVFVYFLFPSILSFFLSLFSVIISFFRYVVLSFFILLFISVCLSLVFISLSLSFYLYVCTYMPICVHVLYTVFMDAVAETGIHLHGECRIVSLSYDDTLLHIYIYIYVYAPPDGGNGASVWET